MYIVCDTTIRILTVATGALNGEPLTEKDAIEKVKTFIAGEDLPWKIDATEQITDQRVDVRLVRQYYP